MTGLKLLTVGKAYLPEFGHLKLYVIEFDSISTNSCQLHIFSHCCTSNYIYHFCIQDTILKSDGLSDSREIKKSWEGGGYIWKGWFLNASYGLAFFKKRFLPSRNQNMKSFLTLQKSKTVSAFSLFCWKPNIIFPFSNLFSLQCDQLLPRKEKLDLSIKVCYRPSK